MEKERVVFFLDYANINRATRENGCRLDYRHVRDYMAEGRFLIDAYAYVPINPRNEHRADATIEELWGSGYIVTSKLGTVAGGTYKCNFDVEIAMDMLRVAYQLKPDIIVLASGDSDFVPLIQEVRKAGARVEVAAFTETAGTEILRKSSDFIDLAVYYQSYLAEQSAQAEEEPMDDPYQDLVQSQNGTNDANDAEEEAVLAEQVQDQLQSQLDAMSEEDVNVATKSLKDESSMSVTDMIQELDL